MAADDSADPIRDNDQWTVDQDGAICKLKKDGLTWAAIATSVGGGKGKNQVKQRFHFIRAQVEAAGLDTDSIGENWAEDMRRQGQGIPSPEKPIASPPPLSSPVAVVAEQVDENEQGQHVTSPVPSVLHLAQAFDEFVEVVEEPAKQSPVHARGGGGKKKKKNKPSTPSSSAALQTTGQIKLSGRVIEKNGVRFAELADPSSTESSNTDSDSSDSDFDHEAEREEQKRFVYHDYWSELYPDQKTYAADSHWTEGDCKVLAVIEAKDEALKFKRIQAGFFNATGRMISDEIIKFKLQQAQ
ncbi:hypothetical protein E8E14_003842 [Neopestalotiopsis sp. 37M]|nr:hypothetical protein E8E14_003842 [Neopestalotiopsis sp. 37M]